MILAQPSSIFFIRIFFTGKSLSEALNLGSTNPQYDKRLFIDLPVQYMKTASSEYGQNLLCGLWRNCSECQKKPICVY